MKKLKIISTFGTRPEAIKMCPLVLELKKRSNIECLVCVTAQHREMLDSVLELFNIKADFDLNIMEPGQTISGITTKALTGLGEVFRQQSPDLVLVHGDTTTTFAGALAAFYEKAAVGHVEAGLRTYDRYSPFPEEMNRCLVGRLADMHFAPTQRNRENLLAEGIKDNIFVTGNTVIDAMRYTVGDGSFSHPFLKSLDFDGKRIITLTCHRRENYGRPMEEIFSAVRDISEAFPDVEIVYPVHLSPTVREHSGKILGGRDNIHLIGPLDAMEMHRLMSKSYMVMTDSGGIQEEAPALGKPVLVLRRETERPEAVAAGTVELAGTQRENIFHLASQLLTDSGKYDQMAHAVNPYGDGNACSRIADAIEYRFGLRDEAPDEFIPSGDTL